MEIQQRKTLAERREGIKKQTLSHYLRSNKSANMHLLEREIMKGLRPKWYAVIHFNDGSNSKYQQRRRLNDDEVEKDLKKIKDALYTEIYGRKWEKKTSRSKSIWGIEYGKSKVKPHVNLIIEELPCPYDTYHSFYVLLDRLLPLRCKCIWRRSANLQPVDIDSFTDLNSYCCKESNFRNSTIIHRLTDYQL